LLDADSQARESPLVGIPVGIVFPQERLTMFKLNDVKGGLRQWR
jgi:hypothetical protein